MKRIRFEYVGVVTAILYSFGYLANGLYLANLGLPAIRLQNVITGFLYFLFLIAPTCISLIPLKLALSLNNLTMSVWPFRIWSLDWPILRRQPGRRRFYWTLPLCYLFCFAVTTCLLDIALDYNSFDSKTAEHWYAWPWIIYWPIGPLLIPEGENAKYLLWIWLSGILWFNLALGWLLVNPSGAYGRRIAWIGIIGGAVLSVHYYVDKVHPRWEASLGGGFYGFYDIQLKSIATHFKSDGRVLNIFLQANNDERMLRDQFVVYEDEVAVYVRPSREFDTNTIWVRWTDAVKFPVFIFHPKSLFSSNETVQMFQSTRIPRELILGIEYLGMTDDLRRKLPWYPSTETNSPAVQEARTRSAPRVP